MSNAKHPLFAVEPDSAVPESDSARPALKTWTTPKVITSTLATDTASGSAAAEDGRTVTHHNS